MDGRRSIRKGIARLRRAAHTTQHAATAALTPKSQPRRTEKQKSLVDRQAFFSG
jgi:hypothetical protein